MSPTLQIVLTVVELVALVAALAVLLLLVTRRLRSVGAAVAEVTTGTGALEHRFDEIAWAAAEVNRGLERLAGEPPETGQDAE